MMEVTTYGYYPGCSLHGSSREYDISMKKSASALGVELKEIPDWNCCGASPAHWLKEELSLALCQRNFDQAKGEGLEVIVAPCAACFNRFKYAQVHLSRDPYLHQKIKELTGTGGHLPTEVLSAVDFFRRELKDGFVPLKSLAPLKVACYYGCLLLRPREVTLEPDPENPTSMEEVVRRLEAEPVNWSFRTECCGASAGVTDPGKAQWLCERIVKSAKKAGADLLVVACPLCHLNLEARQKEGMPVLYLSQLVGLALGLTPEELGMDHLLLDPKPLLREKGVI